MRAPFLVAALLLAASASAEVPMLLGHHGHLLDSQDKGVNEPALEMTFQLHETDNPSVNAPVWTDTRNVAVTGGYYAVMLGRGRATDTEKPLDPALLSKPELWLSVKVGGAEMLPRMRL